MSTKYLQGSHLEKILAREWTRNRRVSRISGTNSSIVLAQLLNAEPHVSLFDLPHLVVVSSESVARRVAADVAAVAQISRPSPPKIHILPDIDLMPYSGLDPSARDIYEKLRFLYHAQNCNAGDVFIAPICSLLQSCMPYDALYSRSIELKVGKSVAGLRETLIDWGYESSAVVEDVGQFGFRGGIFDVFSPLSDFAVRIELFGDEVFSLRTFDSATQNSIEEIHSVKVIPVREHIWSAIETDKLVSKLVTDEVIGKDGSSERENFVRSISLGQRFSGVDFLTEYFWEPSAMVSDHFSTPLHIWIVDHDSLGQQFQDTNQRIHDEYQNVSEEFLRLPPQKFFKQLSELRFPEDSSYTEFSNLVDTLQSDQPIDLLGFTAPGGIAQISFPTYSTEDFKNNLSAVVPGSEQWGKIIQDRFALWGTQEYTITIAVESQSQAQKLKLFFEHADVSPSLYSIRPVRFSESLRVPDDKNIFLQEEVFFGKRSRASSTKDGRSSISSGPGGAERGSRGPHKGKSDSVKQFHDQARRLSFADLNPGDCIVHSQHGIGVYDGLKKMTIGDVENEFIQLSYKDKDKLYLPVYRLSLIQKYSGQSDTTALDKLGGPGWEKTTTKARGSAKDLAMDLLALYAKRKEHPREPLHFSDSEFQKFENKFPFDETEDQHRAISDFLDDIGKPIPMDRLICGDVGFGKTEVAMRAAFAFASEGKQVAVLAPTTVLVFQHLETFQKRFKGWPIEIRALNRFVSTSESKKIITQLKDGSVQIVIGTHRLLSKDVQFKDLGLLVIDEEQRFGVAHKERLRAMKTSVDTIALSATPIPRTLNMSLSGIRDLSLINTAPIDRLPVRTFVTKWNDTTIRNAILAEMKRGGQVYFIHNRVQSIYGIADELRKLVPEARIKVGHGQQEDEDLERTMVSFFHKEIDVLLCTTIVESGMDVPSANTIIIDQAHTLGLSQLYQLRGRVGRSRLRAFCYLITPKNRTLDKQAQERLKVIHDHTALGSGIRIAQYDLELRGSGDLLGHDQSGHINAVGYELFMDLLNEEIDKLKGLPIKETIDPEINLKIPALIPDNYVPDIRVRLSFYKAMSDVRSEEDLESIESSLRDQFGALPPQTVNLLGLMILRMKCKTLGIKDLSAGMKSLSLLMSEHTPLTTPTLIRLATKENKKYSITPDNRLNIRLQNITWENALQELVLLEKLN